MPEACFGALFDMSAGHFSNDRWKNVPLEKYLVGLISRWRNVLVSFLNYEMPYNIREIDSLNMMYRKLIANFINLY